MTDGYTFIMRVNVGPDPVTLTVQVEAANDKQAEDAARMQALEQVAMQEMDYRGMEVVKRTRHSSVLDLGADIINWRKEGNGDDVYVARGLTFCEEETWSLITMRNVRFTGCTFSNCHFYNHDIEGTMFEHCTFNDCTFERVVMRSTTFTRTTMTNTTFLNVAFRSAVMTNVTLDTVTLSLTKFEELYCYDSKFKAVKAMETQSVGDMEFTSCKFEAVTSRDDVALLAQMAFRNCRFPTTEGDD